MSLPTPPPDTGDSKEEPIDAPIYLIPLSKSAVSSSQLQANNKKRLASTTIPLYVSDLQKLSSHWRAGVPNALKLAPTLDTSYYTLGTDSNSHVVIQTEIEDECWVNYRHCELIPDPDRAAITVFNTSTTTFTVQNIDKRDPEMEILKKHSMPIGEGKWYLKLGRGLKFILIVPPRDPDPDQELLVPPRDPDTHQGLLVRRGSSQNLIRQCDMGVRLIGRTNRALIYRDQRCGIVVAAKVYKRIDLPFAARTWENEKNILAYLSAFQNKHITNLVDMDGSRLTLYIDYIAGRDLEKMVTKSGFARITESQAYTIWQDTTKGLKFLHHHGVIHNDIKPSNILFYENRAVLCDFGIATDGSTLHYNGTPSYISPDIMHRKERSRPDDIWALGVTMLFVFRFISLPGHSWTIKKLKKREPKTMLAMDSWLREIRDICQHMPKRFDLLRRMLTESRTKRITASQLSAKLTQSLCLEVS